MVWLTSPESQLSKTFFGIESQLNIKKVMGRNVWMCFVSTVLTYIALNALEILTTCINSVDIYIAFNDMVGKP